MIGIIVVLIFLSIAVLITIHALSISDYCYNMDFPLMKYGFNGTEHEESYIKCMEDNNLNPQSIPIRILQGRDIQ